MPRTSTRLTLLLAATATLALAASPALALTGGTVGNDISYPQCGGAFPTGASFGIVGVNDGRPGTLNPCLGTYNGSPAGSELSWAARTNATAKILYVNTADPGNMYNRQPVADWPTGSSPTDPYGSCTTVQVGHGKNVATVGANSTACAWQYGHDRATQDASWLQTAAGAVGADTNPGDYTWWLDVETANSWQSGGTGQAMNVAVLRGMADAFQHLTGTAAPTVGVYSTSYQWGQITGTPSTGALGNLAGVPTWIPGATSQQDAASRCAPSSFTGGPVQLAQWTTTYDNDYAC